MNSYYTRSSVQANQSKDSNSKTNKSNLKPIVLNTWPEAKLFLKNHGLLVSFLKLKNLDDFENWLLVQKQNAITISNLRDCWILYYAKFGPGSFLKFFGRNDVWEPDTILDS